jgi:acyl-CoA synthetase (AMP-forming)/AMP-acid ligase II
MSNPIGVPQCTLENYERDFAGRHLLPEALSWWAARRPHAPAIISYDRGQSIDWLTLESTTTRLAQELLRRGFKKGDFFAVALPMSLEHVFLEYACFKIGVVHAPLDLRLRIPEVLRSLDLLRPKGFAYLSADLGAAVKSQCHGIELFLAQPEIAEMIARGSESGSPGLQAAFSDAIRALGENDIAQAIFTTGSTGSPKAALLSHRNITAQNMCLGAGFGFDNERILLNLPPSHVGGQAEVLMTSLFWGGSVVMLDVFDPAKSLDAIQKHGVTMLGQIPAMFQFEWRMSDYSRYDLSSLRKAVYGGQGVPREFIARMATMAPLIGTGLGLTETAGFCTYTPLSSAADDIAAGVGFDMPAYPMSIRRDMKEDGVAGEVLPDGSVGNICFHGPQTFRGYLKDAKATARAISADGWLYTGDLGHVDNRGLHFSGRARWVIKPAGYQVFPGDVESHFSALEKVSACGAVGVEHRLLSEAIVLFAEKKAGVDLSVAELKQHARNLASYMRPLYYVIFDPGQMPVNRVIKTDYVRLSDMARQQVAEMRAKGGWDT